MKRATGDREDDWGVPLPGDIVSDDCRSNSHLQRLPLGQLDAVQLFGRTAPLMVDLGCGNGRASILSALARPGVDHLAVDIFPGAIRHACRRANRRGLTNIRLAVADARDVLNRLLGAQSVAEVHLYHPQPIYDLADAPKRLITPAFLLHIHRVLLPSGFFVLQTDHPAYWSYLKSVLPFFFTVQEQAVPWPDAPEGRTRREILARQWQLPIFRAICKPHALLDRIKATHQAQQLLLPRFDADRRWQDVDANDTLSGASP